MENTYIGAIDRIALHKVGNKGNEEVLIATEHLLNTSEANQKLLSAYFLYPFKFNNLFNFQHESDFNLNEVFTFASRIFESKDCFLEQSTFLARHLYDCSNHPNIKGGEFFVAYFEDCILDGKNTQAVGLFKAEQKDTFLKILFDEKAFDVDSEIGLNLQKLDKGCIIFNLEKEDGYVVAVVDQTNKAAEARYWLDEFLGLTERKDHHFQTHHALTMCKNFISNELPVHFEVSKVDQVDLLNKSAKFFKEKEVFNLHDYAQEVIAQPELIAHFNDFKSDFQKNREMAFDDQFEISEFTLSKKAKDFKSVLKLDKNFHIYIHGNANLIEQGTENDGRKFYKIYYNEEH